MDTAAVILAFTFVSNLSLGLFILQRNSRALANRYFFALSVMISLWATANYFTEKASLITLNRFSNRLAYLFALWTMILIYQFCIKFFVTTNEKSKHSFAQWLMIILTSALSVSDLVAGHVVRKGGNLTFLPGKLVILYILILITILFFAVKKLLSKRVSADVQEKRQIKIIFIGFVSSVLLGIFVTLIIPIMVDNFETAKYGPLLSLALVGTISYAIVKYGLFDIRAVVAKAVVYTLLISTLAGLYLLLVFTITRSFLRTQQPIGYNHDVQITYLIASLFVAFSFGPLKRIFDRLSNALFFRHDYDPQRLIDSFNKMLATSHTLFTLAENTIKILNDNFRPEFSLVIINDQEIQKSNLYGKTTHLFNREAFESTLYKTMTPRTEVLLTDGLEAINQEMYRMMKKVNAAALVQLSAPVGARVERVGYIIIGYKRSGQNFSQKDVDVLEIIANPLIIAIQNSIRLEEIEKFSETLKGKVEKATMQLRHSNQKLKAMDETKDEFISMASHQLRTPLTSVKGYISMVLDGDVGHISPPQRKMLEQAFTSSQRMVYLISDLLNVSRLQTGKFVIEPVGSHLDQVVADEVNQLKESAKIHNLELIYDRPSDFPTVYIDETKIRQVMMNFMDNAIYYTPAYGKVWVSLRASESSIEFTVKDTGMGVPKAQRHQLFTKFFRADNARTARPDGTGLGLFMAKKVVVAQGGAIIFESEEGKGSTFGFSFPLSALVMSTKNT